MIFGFAAMAPAGGWAFDFSGKRSSMSMINVCLFILKVKPRLIKHNRNVSMNVNF